MTEKIISGLLLFNGMELVSELVPEDPEHPVGSLTCINPMRIVFGENKGGLTFKFLPMILSASQDENVFQFNKNHVLSLYKLSPDIEHSYRQALSPIVTKPEPKIIH